MKAGPRGRSEQGVHGKVRDVAHGTEEVLGWEIRRLLD